MVGCCYVLHHALDNLHDGHVDRRPRGMGHSEMDVCGLQYNQWASSIELYCYLQVAVLEKATRMELCLVAFCLVGFLLLMT